MLPLLTFATGLIVGIAGVRVARSARPGDGLKAAADGVGAKARQGFESARSGLRDAAVTGLSAVEKTSAGLRERLNPAAPAGPVVETPAEADKPKPAPKAARATAKSSAARPARRRPAAKAVPPGTPS